MDYSRFDKIDYDAESDEEAPKPTMSAVQQPSSVVSTSSGNDGATVFRAGGGGMPQPSSSSSSTPTPLQKVANAEDAMKILPNMNNIDNLEKSVLPTKKTGRTKDGRLKFEYEGRTIYEWEQGLEEVNIYLVPPPKVPRKLIDIKITHTHLTVGITGAPTPFIDEDTGGPIKVDESTWTLDTDSATGAREISISLCKMNKAEVWVCALKGREGAGGAAASGPKLPSGEVDEVTKEELRRKMMLDRFQEEHPGFDFSGADFNGMVPDARTFMDGVKR